MRKVLSAKVTITIKREIDCLIVHVGTLYTHKFYEGVFILEAYESTLLVKNKLGKKNKIKKS